MTISSYPLDNTVTFEALQRDAFGYLRVSNKQGEFEYKQIHSRHPTIIQERVYGAIIEHGAITGSFNVGDTFEDDEESTCTITAVGAGDITYDCKGGNQFTDTATLTILTGTGVGSTATINTHNTGADLDYSYNRSSTIMSVGTLSGQRVIRQTPYMQYISGDSKIYNATSVFGEINANQELYCIYGDDLNGWGFCVKNSVVNIITRSNITGSVVEALIPRADWNVDKLNGQGPSGITLDITKFQIEGGDLQWLGGGSRRYFLSINGNNVLVHQIDNANINDAVYSKTASLPIRWEIKNTGATTANTLESVCCAVNNEGGNAISGLDYVIDSGKTLRSITGDTPIGLIVMKNEFPAGQPNRQAVQIVNYSLEATGNNVLVRIFHVHGIKSITGTPITDYDSELGIDYYTDITDITAVHFHSIGSTQVTAGTAGKGFTVDIPISTLAAHNKIYQNLESDGSTGFLVFAYPYGNADVWWGIKVIGKE